jgi:murein DD-endopeptidase MepM/ murein hydrolase activator NlpD
MPPPSPTPAPPALTAGVFPLPIIPTTPWHNVPTSKATHFGAPRDAPYPTHGACDLLAPAGTEVYAVADGDVWYEGWFYESKKTVEVNGVERVVCRINLHEMTIVHGDHFIARYGEIAPGAVVKAGDHVTAGQKIAVVGANCDNNPMLHFELFAHTARRENLSVNATETYLYVPRRAYSRRNDLLDPTPFLDEWAASLRLRQQNAESFKVWQSNPHPARYGIPGRRNQ